MLLGIGMAGLLRSKIIGSSICVLTMALCYLDPSFVSYLDLDYGSEGKLLPGFFAFGALLAINKDRVEVSLKVLVGLGLIAACIRFSPAFHFAFLAAFLIGALSLSSIGFLRAIRLPGDYSYGIYVYGWPVQQSVVEIWPKLGIHGNQAVSMAVAFLLAIFSWHVVEKPSIALGRRLAAALGGSTVHPASEGGMTTRFSPLNDQNSALADPAPKLPL